MNDTETEINDERTNSMCCWSFFSLPLNSYIDFFHHSATIHRMPIANQIDLWMTHFFFHFFSVICSSIACLFIDSFFSLLLNKYMSIVMLWHVSCYSKYIKINISLGAEKTRINCNRFSIDASNAAFEFSFRISSSNLTTMIGWSDATSFKRLCNTQLLSFHMVRNSVCHWAFIFKQ